jgi:C1A family cysteine protease
MSKQPKKARARKAAVSVKAAKPTAQADFAVARRTTTGGVTRVLNCEPSKATEDDWRLENSIAAGNLDAAPPVPAAKDLRASWWKIGDQAETGSCVGWATADSVLRWHFVKAGRLGQNDLLSMRFIWMAAKETDEFVSQPTTFIESDGTSLKSALDIARKYGCVLDGVLPFNSNKLFAGETKTFYAIASRLKIASYVNLGRDPANWRRWLGTKGPILTRLTCDSTWMNAKATGGVLSAYDTLTARGGHAVAMVGYNAERFIIRNSWGTELWGDKGFGYASNAYAAAAFTEAYGVEVS